MEPTVHYVLAFHRVDRAAYEHLLSLGAGRHASRDAVALLMWLHRKAGVDAVSRVRALVRTQAAAAQLVAEARALLLHGADDAESTTALLSCACVEDDDDDARVRQFLASCCGTAADAPRRGVAEVLAGVGALVFDDQLHAILRRWYEDGRNGGAIPMELAAPYRRCVGVAAAAAEVQEEDGRSLFITFSKGFPLTRVEVEEFFTERWGGDCVAKVMMQKTPPGEPPTYGRIVFRRAATAAAVLAGRPLVKLVVTGATCGRESTFPGLRRHSNTRDDHMEHFVMHC